MSLWGEHLTKSHPNPNIWWNFNLIRSLTYGGYIWPKVSLTWKSVKNVKPDLKPQLLGVHLTKCKKEIWKFEHTLHFMFCFTEVFSMKDHSECFIYTIMNELLGLKNIHCALSYIAFRVVASHITAYKLLIGWVVRKVWQLTSANRWSFCGWSMGIHDMLRNWLLCCLLLYV